MPPSLPSHAGGIAIEEPPNDSSNILVRPEVRAQFDGDSEELGPAPNESGLVLVNHLAPGDALVRSWAWCGVSNRSSVLKFC